MEFRGERAPLGSVGLVRHRGRLLRQRRHGVVLGRLQVELLNTRKWATTLELAAAIADYIDNFYNVERRHSYLGNISPTEFETLWTSTYSIPQLA